MRRGETRKVRSLRLRDTDDDRSSESDESPVRTPMIAGFIRPSNEGTSSMSDSTLLPSGSESESVDSKATRTGARPKTKDFLGTYNDHRTQARPSSLSRLEDRTSGPSRVARGPIDPIDAENSLFRSAVEDTLRQLSSDDTATVVDPDGELFTVQVGLYADAINQLGRQIEGRLRREPVDYRRQVRDLMQIAPGQSTGLPEREEDGGDQPDDIYEPVISGVLAVVRIRPVPEFRGRTYLHCIGRIPGVGRVVIKSPIHQGLITFVQHIASLVSIGDHQNVVRMVNYGWGLFSGVEYIAMQMYAFNAEDMLGGVATFLGRDELISLLRDWARGIQRIHQRHLVHRDIRPANVVVLGDARQWRGAVTGLEYATHRAGNVHAHGIGAGDIQQHVDIVAYGQIIEAFLPRVPPTPIGADETGDGVTVYRDAFQRHLAHLIRQTTAGSLSMDAFLSHPLFWSPGRLMLFEDQLYEFLSSLGPQQNERRVAYLESITAGRYNAWFDRIPYIMQRAMLLGLLTVKKMSDGEKAELRRVIENYHRTHGESGVPWTTEQLKKESVRLHGLLRPNSIYGLLAAMRNRRHHVQGDDPRVILLLGDTEQSHFVFWSGRFPALFLDLFFNARQLPGIRNVSDNRSGLLRYYTAVITFYSVGAEVLPALFRRQAPQ